MLVTDYKIKNLPRTIELEDLDLALFNYISNENMQIEGFWYYLFLLKSSFFYRLSL